MKFKAFSFLKFNVFNFGEQKVSQFVLFECKYLFSIIIFYFHKSNGIQDRYHTHAFNAFSIKLFGKYTEYILLNKVNERYEIKERTNIFQYFPRNSYHKIGNSTGCSTILFSGKWNECWEEYKDKITTYYSWSRNKKYVQNDNYMFESYIEAYHDNIGYKEFNKHTTITMYNDNVTDIIVHDENNHLKYLSIDAPKLKNIKFIGCENLIILDIYAKDININLSNFKKLSGINSNIELENKMLLPNKKCYINFK